LAEEDECPRIGREPGQRERGGMGLLEAFIDGASFPAKKGGSGGKPSEAMAAKDHGDGTAGGPCLFACQYGFGRFSRMRVSLEAQTLAAVFTIEIPARLVGGKAMIVTGQTVAGGMGYRERGVPHQVRRKRPRQKILASLSVAGRLNAFRLPELQSAGRATGDIRRKPFSAGSNSDLVILRRHFLRWLLRNRNPEVANG
jgi:hypothetical protein